MPNNVTPIANRAYSPEKEAERKRKFDLAIELCIDDKDPRPVDTIILQDPDDFDYGYDQYCDEGISHVM